MSQALLLDENLSERLLPLLSDRFPCSTHVRMVGLGGASDTVIWEWASQQRMMLVTKDEDFLDLSVARGVPPKVVCLAIGNASNAATPRPGFCCSGLIPPAEDPALPGLQVVRSPSVQ